MPQETETAPTPLEIAETLTDTELEAYMEEGGLPEPLPEGEAAPEATDEGQPETTDEAEAPPAQQETAPEETGETPTAEEAPEPEAAEEPEITDSSIIQAELAAAKADAKHWESVAGRHAGRMDFLDKRLQSLETSRPPQRATRREETEEGIEPESEERYETPRRAESPGREGMTEWAVEQAQDNAKRAFLDAHPKIDNVEDFAKAASEVSAKATHQTHPALYSDDPREVSEGVTRLLEETLWEHERGLRAAHVETLKEKKAEQSRKIAEAKKNASVSASGSTPPPKPQPQSPEDMDDKTLESAMREALADGRR